MKRLVIVSDLHCGSIFGITPTYWQEKRDSKYHKSQKESYQTYLDLTNKWKNPDILLCNGDAIEGSATRQGGVELITTDRNLQCDMAVKCLELWNAKQTLMTYGTPYHTGDTEDFEYNIANRLDATIGGNLFFEAEGLVINARHKIGASSIPHGRATPLLKEIAWNLLNSVTCNEPIADILIRSHVHYHVWVESEGRVAFTTPGLQLKRGRFGSRQCTGSIHWGAIRLGLDKGQIVEKEVICKNLKGNKPRVIKIK